MATIPADLSTAAPSGLAGVQPLQLLLFASEPAASRLAPHLDLHLGAKVAIVSSLRQCQEALQRDVFDLVLLEEIVASENPQSMDSLYRLAGTALVVETTFSLASPARIVRQLRSSLQRRHNDRRAAHAAALASLRHELSASVTGILLESQLALQTAGPQLAPALEHLLRLSELLCQRLEL